MAFMGKKWGIFGNIVFYLGKIQYFRPVFASKNPLSFPYSSNHLSEEYTPSLPWQDIYNFSDLSLS